MSQPTLQPVSQMSKVILPATGTAGSVSASLPFNVYGDNADFIEGASMQVAYTYRKLGGDILDIELKADNVYAAYQEATLEYSYLLNLHQSKNILSDALGNTTGTFDHGGNLKAGPLKTALTGTQVALKYPRFEFSYARRVADAIGSEASVGGSIPEYSASFKSVRNQQDYDLQQIVVNAATNNSDAATGNAVPYKGKLKVHPDAASGASLLKRIIVRKVYYKTPRAMWRFYGYYGGIGVVGNYSTYGQFADDATFELIPTWQNKLQAMAYEDSIYTRTSHYSYEIKGGNKLRLFPIPSSHAPAYFWFNFTIPIDVWEDSTEFTENVDGINNMNTLPFANIPYANINSIGKQWIRRFALALTKEILGQVRSKFGSIPIPGESVTLNGDALITQGKEEQDKLREELKTLLSDLEYNDLIKSDQELVEATNKIMSNVPLGIFVG
tara:strand:- start:5739 stop:7064 length:1326 start_codon:yes stop_codon:yes gene_type:complete